MTNQPTPAEAMAREAVFVAYREYLDRYDFKGDHFWDKANAALTRALTLARTQEVINELQKRRPKTEPKNHGGRCWWCKWMAEAQAAFDAAVKAVMDHG